MLVNLRMSSLDQMKLQPLVELSLILIMASYSKGEEWSINVTRNITAEIGGNVTIQCSFTGPRNLHFDNATFYWKIRRQENFGTYDKTEDSIYLFHDTTSLVDKKYRGNTELTGERKDRNCSVKISNITANETGIYFRVITSGKNNYSFINSNVSIHLSDSKPIKGDASISGPIYAAIFLPVAAALIIIFVIGFFIFRHRREQSFTREDSGYYANFSRTSSNQATRKELHKKQDNKELPELKTFDEPVYINMKAPADHMDQRVDQSAYHTDNVYANMDYPK